MPKARTDIDIDYVIHAYVIDKKSAIKISKEVKCSKHTILKILEKHNIKRRTGKEAHIEHPIKEKNPFWRKHHTKESKEKMIESRKGIFAKEKNPAFKKVDTNYIINSYTIDEKSTTLIAKELSCGNHVILNRLKDAGIKIRNNSESQRGPKSPAWRGGISFLPYCHKFNKPLKEEIRELFGRKCYICEKTEKENNKKLDVHHCDFNKQQGCKGNLTWKLLPLCKSCHAWTTNHRHEAFALLVNYWSLNPEINFNTNF